MIEQRQLIFAMRNVSIFFLFLLASSKPDHIVIWLDEYIGNPREYHHLKKYFRSIIAINSPVLCSVGYDQDIDNLIRINDSYIIDFFNIHHIKYDIYVFSTVEDCSVFIEKRLKSNRTIFLICSASLAKHFIPQIFHEKLLQSIYVLTIDIMDHYEWAYDYMDKVQLFSHELDLFARLTRDIADYYMKKSSELITMNPLKSLTYLHWTRHLLINANVIDDFVTSRNTLRCVDKEIMRLEKNLNSQIKYTEDEKFGIVCT